LANIVVSAGNNINTGVSWYGNADAAAPLSNLANAYFSKYWAYSPGSNGDGNLVAFGFSLNPVARASHVAFCRHNLGEAAQIRLRAGLSRLDLDFTDEAELTSPYVTFGGGTNGTRTNEYGVLVSGSCPRNEHDRRYFDNGFKYSEDIAQADWLESGGCKKYSDGKTVAFEKVDAELYQVLPQLYNDSYELRWQVRLVSGNGDFAFKVYNGTSNVLGATLTATSEWKWLDSLIATGANTVAGNASIIKKTAAGVFQVRRMQIRRGASGGRYRKTTTQRRYQRIGLITEAAATNSLLRSAELDDAAWTKLSVTVTPNSAVAPDGTTSMDRVTAASSGEVYQAITAGGTTARATSVFFRKDPSAAGTVSLRLAWVTGGVTQQLHCTFNPTTGEFVSSGVVTGTPTLKAAGVRDIGGGYFRAYLMGVGTDAANTQSQTNIAVEAAGYVDAWGVQNEADCVTTYIPTTTAAVTRTVDTAVVEPATWVPYAWNAGEGTIYHEARLDEIGADIAREGSYVFATGSGSTSIRSYMSYLAGTAGGSHYHEIYDSGGALQYRSTPTTVALGATVRMAYRYRLNDWAFALNGSILGSAVGSPSALAVPAVTAINLMANAKTTAYLRRFTLWPSGKANADLQALTTSGPSAIDVDTGWDDALQMSMAGDVPTLWGHDYDVIKTFTDRAVEWVRVALYDPAKTSSSTPFECGRVFMGKLTLQPASNPEYGLGDGWIERSSVSESEDGQQFFTERARQREVAFSLPFLTHAEGAKLHEMQGSGGIVEETLYLPDPDDEAACQRYGFVGRLQKLDPLMYPLFATRANAMQIRKKR